MTSTTANPFPKRLLLAALNILWLVAWLVSLSLVALFPLRWFLGDALQPVRMVSYITPWLLIFSLPLLITAGLARRKWLASVLAVGSLGIILTFAHLFLPKTHATPVPEDFSFKIMSFNLHGEPDIDGIVDVIRHEKPDVLLIQEYSPALVSQSFHELDDLYPKSNLDVVTQTGYGQAIFSRFPLKRDAINYYQGRAQKVTVETPEGPITVWNVHTIPPNLIPADQFDTQIAALSADIPQIHGPFIVGGDFNATSQSTTYQTMTHYLKDSFWEAGWGFGFSFPATPFTIMNSKLQIGPLWRIDYILHNQDFVVTNESTLTSSGGSDHFPIMAQLSMRRSTSQGSGTQNAGK